MPGADDVTQEAEARLLAAERALADARSEREQLSRRLEALEADLAHLQAQSDPGPWPSLRAGMAAPLSVLAAALFFDVGAWPLGLAAVVTVAVQALQLPRLTRGDR
ncbi:MAG: hypothetical protein INH41_25445 [Myxococcaceae bacterium]|jgi:hypothetical protein|nr:hypothetical protein [Myxococcaceae bacterium]MCA3015745.1 hypothetical protein [Myxococcaceae bacterium]